MTAKVSWWMPYLLAKGSMALAENWAWAVTRVVAEKQDAPQGCGRIRPCWRRGRVRDANKHDNLAELTTFSESIYYDPDGWPHPAESFASSPDRFSSSAVRLLRRGLAAALLGLPLLAGLSAEAAALTFSGTTITQGETRTFTVTDVPASWTGTPEVKIVGGSATASSDCTVYNFIDVCLNSEAWDSTTRTLTFVLRARSDSDTAIETFTIRIEDSDDASQSHTQAFSVTPPLPAVTLSGPGTMEEGRMILVGVNLSEAPKSRCQVKVRARRADGTVYGSTAFIARGNKSGMVIVVHNNDSVWQESGYYDMPVYTAPGDCYASIPRASATYIVRVMDDGDPRPNRPPEFSGQSTTHFRFFSENTTGVTKLGAPLPAATDPDGDTLTYTIEGTDAASFDFDAAARQIRSRAGVTYDYEAKHIHYFQIKADDGRGGTDTQDVEVAVFDVDEPPSAPAVTAVNPTPGSTTSLDASWTAPDNTGKPAITSYDLRYRTGSSGAWADGPQDVPGTSSQITGLDSGTTYQVQVRATNDEGDGDWSNAGSGTTSGSSTTPVATFGSAASSAGEGAGTQNVAVNLSPAPQSAITLAYTVGGTATAGTDFGCVSKVVEIRRG
ncbi:MAG: fibronectin type III domain-containing protein [Synechococcus sp. SB0668_bin_13]|nr:fibronectin type III domain-containing protein [Synechococcus sp. SB0668_bin_13]